jgi:hypothetical protein
LQLVLLTQTMHKQLQQQQGRGTGTSTVGVKWLVLLLQHWQLGLRLQICCS